MSAPFLEKPYPPFPLHVITVVLIAAALSPAVARAQRYSVQPLASPAVGPAVPASINDAGVTVLNSAPGPQFASAVSTPSSSSLVPPPNGFEFTGKAVSGSGQVAGTLRSTDGPTTTPQTAVAAIYDDGLWTTLPGPSVTGATFAFGINDAGVVVGAWNDPDGYVRAACWNDNHVTIFDTTSPNGSYAMGINDRGTIVGFTCDGQGMIWHVGGGAGTSITNLPPGHVGVTSLINNKDQVLVPVYAPDNDVHWYLWDSGYATEISALLGISDAYVTGFNDQGQIIARVEGYAAIYDDGTLSDLNTLIPTDSGWVLQYATALNNFGQVAGYGTHHGQPAAFLLTPVPEPSATASLCCAAFPLLQRRRTSYPAILSQNRRRM